MSASSRARICADASEGRFPGFALTDGRYRGCYDEQRWQQVLAAPTCIQWWSVLLDEGSKTVRLLELVPLDFPCGWDGAESSVESVCNDVLLLVRLSAILYIVLAQQ